MYAGFELCGVSEFDLLIEGLQGRGKLSRSQAGDSRFVGLFPDIFVSISQSCIDGWGRVPRLPK